MLKISIVGNIGRDANTREQNGRFVVNFPLAHNERFKNDKGEFVEKSVWVNCSRWYDRNPEKLVAYLKKGSVIAIDGSLDVGLYTTKDQQKAVEIKCNYNDLQIISSTANKPEQSASNQAQENIPSSNNGMDQAPPDDLPF